MRSRIVYALAYRLCARVSFMRSRIVYALAYRLCARVSFMRSRMVCSRIVLAQAPMHSENCHNLLRMAILSITDNLLHELFPFR
jgi:hypothetical protein